MNIIKTSNMQTLIISTLSIFMMIMPAVSSANNYANNKHHAQRTQNTHQPKHIAKRIKRDTHYAPSAGHHYQPRYTAPRSHSRSHAVYVAPPTVVYAPPQHLDLHNLNVVFGLPTPSIRVILRH